jgi:Tol biopolymer transport system component
MTSRGRRCALGGLLALGFVAAPVAVSSPASGGPVAERIVTSALMVRTGGARVTTMAPDGTSRSAVDVPDILEDFNKTTWSHDGTRLLHSNTVILDGHGNLVAFRPAVSNADGSGYRLLRMRWRPMDFYCSAWSLDDARILCSMRGDIISVRVSDGRGKRPLTDNPFGGQDLAVGYSPDGQQLAWLRERPGRTDELQREALFVSDADGSNARRLTKWSLLLDPELSGANWSPDGTHIISATQKGRIVEIDVATGAVTRVPLGLRDSDFAAMPDYSPDGLQVVFAMFRNAPTDLFVANLDGSGLHRITRTGNRAELSPDWH